MWFSHHFESRYIARLYSKCVDKAVREKSKDFMLHGGWLL